MSFKQIKVVVAGHAGLNKLRCVKEQIIPFLLKRDLAWQNVRDGRQERECSRITEQQVLILELEKTIPSTAYSIIGTPTGRSSWISSFLQMRQSWRSSQSDAKYVFLLAHLSFQSDSHFYTPITWTHRDDEQNVTFPLLDFLVEEFKPDFVVTLIDDIYSVQSRLNPQRHFRLSELLRWRNVESLLADYVMDCVEIESGFKKSILFPHLRSPIFSIRQPVNSLFKYISDPASPRVYLSYPISKPLKRWRKENEKDLIDQINHFRYFFSSEVSAFDPLTINERPIQISLDDFRETERARFEQESKNMLGLIQEVVSSLEGEEISATKEKLSKLESAYSASRTTNQSEDREIELPLGGMWPIDKHQTISPVSPAEKISIRRSEVDEVITADQARSEVDRQIRVRDLRLINQSDCVVVYRPGLSKEDWSTGTFVECGHALDSGKAVIILSDRDDAKPLGPFDHKPHGDDVIIISDPTNSESRLEAFSKALVRVQHYSSELIQKGLR